MNVQYISDTQGRHTAVVIPIEEWNSLTEKYQELKEPETPRKKPSDFVGVLSPETARQMITDIEQSRDEWERAI